MTAFSNEFSNSVRPKIIFECFIFIFQKDLRSSIIENLKQGHT